TMRYPAAADEKRMLTTYNRPVPEPRAVVGPQDVIRLQELGDSVHVADEVFDYILGLAQYTRSHRRVYLGASPRAGLALLRAAKALALVRGRDFVLPDDVKGLAPLVLPHRVIMTPQAELDGAHAAAGGG